MFTQFVFSWNSSWLPDSYAWSVQHVLKISQWQLLKDVMRTIHWEDVCMTTNIVFLTSHLSLDQYTAYYLYTVVYQSFQAGWYHVLASANAWKYLSLWGSCREGWGLGRLGADAESLSSNLGVFLPHEMRSQYQGVNVFSKNLLKEPRGEGWFWGLMVCATSLHVCRWDLLRWP